MTEAVNNNYEHSSGPIHTIAVPYARLTDATPTPSNPCELTSLLAGTQLGGTIISIDAGDSIAGVLEGLGDGQERRVADAASDANNVAEILDVGRSAQRADDVDDFVALGQVGQFGRGLADSLPDQPDCAFLGISISNSQGDAFAVFIAQA